MTAGTVAVKRYSILAAVAPIAAGDTDDVTGGFYPALGGIAVLMALAAGLVTPLGRAPCGTGY